MNTYPLIRTALAITLIILASLLFATTPADAATYTWSTNNVYNGSLTNDWFTGGPNTQGTWTNGFIPVSGNTAIIQFYENTTTAFTNTTAITRRVNLNNGGAAFELGTLTFSGLGSATANANLTNNLTGDALNFSAATGRINLNANRNIVYNLYNNLQLGTAGSASTLTISGNGTGTFNINGTITELQTGGGSSLIKSGSSTVTLNGNLAFSGSLTMTNGTLNLYGNNTYSGGTQLQGGTINVNNALSLGTGTVTVTGNSTLNPVYGAYPALTNSLVVNSGVTLTIGNATQFYGLTFNGVVSGSGTIVYGGNNDANTRESLGLYNSANTFTGTLRSLGGAAQVSVNSLGDGGSVILNGSSFSLNAGTASSLLFNTRKITLAAAGTVNNNNGADGTTITINTALAFSGAGTRALTLGGSNAGDNTFGGIIANNGGSAVSLIKADGGTWILSGTNTYSGSTLVTGGMLVFANPSAKSPSTLVTATVAAASVGLGVGGSGYYSATDLSNLFANTLAGFALTNASSGVGIYTAAGDFTYGANITGSRSLTKLGPDTLILSGNNTYSGTTKISAGVLQAQPGTGLSSNSYLQLDGGVLQANGSFVRTNSTTLSGRNFQWTANGGGFAAVGGKLTVRIGNTATTPQVWTNVVANNGILGTLKFGSATADSEVEFLNAIDLRGGTRTVDVMAGAGGDFAKISGVISNSTGTGSLRKTGDGILVLSGANTYNGSTTVAGGTLLYNGSLAAGAGVVTVNSNTTLGGSGVINRTVNINAGGTLAPGTNSAGIFTVGNLTLASNATFAVQIGGNFLGDFDQLFVTGTATLSNSTLDVSLINAFVPTSGDVGNAYTIMDISGTSPTGIGTFAGLAEGAEFAASGVNFSISYLGGDGNDILLTLTAIPEPGSLVLVGAGLGLLLILRRRQSV